MGGSIDREMRSDSSSSAHHHRLLPSLLPTVSLKPAHTPTPKHTILTTPTPSSTMSATSLMQSLRSAVRTPTLARSFRTTLPACSTHGYGSSFMFLSLLHSPILFPFLPTFMLRLTSYITPPDGSTKPGSCSRGIKSCHDGIPFEYILY